MRRNERTLAGFTLIEMLVAIGIVVLLVGLTVTASNALVAKAETRRTDSTLRLLDMALQEWELTADRKLTWGDEEGQFDVWSSRAHDLIISEVLDVIQRHPASRDILARIDPEFVYTYREGETPSWIQGVAMTQLPTFQARESITVLDAWGWPIYATHPGAVDLNRPPADADGTVRTLNESYFGAARNRQMNFISAGPDGHFGRTSAPEDSMPRRQTRDNVYLYPLVP